jgi:hypothetical protein
MNIANEKEVAKGEQQWHWFKHFFRQMYADWTL